MKFLYEAVGGGDARQQTVSGRLGGYVSCRLFLWGYSTAIGCHCHTATPYNERMAKTYVPAIHSPTQKHVEMGRPEAITGCRIIPVSRRLAHKLLLARLLCCKCAINPRRCHAVSTECIWGQGKKHFNWTVRYCIIKFDLHYKQCGDAKSILIEKGQPSPCALCVHSTQRTEGMCANVAGSYTLRISLCTLWCLYNRMSSCLP